MIRIFASWFSAFGVGLLWFLKERDWGRLQNIAFGVVGLLMHILQRRPA